MGYLLVGNETKRFDPQPMMLNSISVAVRHGEFGMGQGLGYCRKTAFLRSIAMAFQDHAILPYLNVLGKVPFASSRARYLPPRSSLPSGPIPSTISR